MQIPDYILEQLRLFPSLKSNQIETSHAAAEAQVMRIIGEKPERTEYLQRLAPMPQEQDYSPSYTHWRLKLEHFWSEFSQNAQPLDAALIPILIFLFGISLSHMLVWSGTIARGAYETQPSDFQGFWMSLQAWMTIHQVGMFGLSEFGVLFFYARFSLHRQELALDPNRKKSAWDYLNLNLMLAVAFAFITIFANISSLMHGAFKEGQTDYEAIAFAVIIGTLVPVTTMYLGERIAELTLAYILTRKKKIAQYNEDLDKWKLEKHSLEAAFDRIQGEWYAIANAPRTYEGYQKLFAVALVEYYKRYKFKLTDDSYSSEYDAWTPELEKWLAAREIANAKRMDDLEAAVDFFSVAPSETSLI